MLQLEVFRVQGSVQVFGQVPGLQEHGGLLGARVLQLEHIVARILLHRLPDLLRLRPVQQSRLRRGAPEAFEKGLDYVLPYARHRPGRIAWPATALAGLLELPLHDMLHSKRLAVRRRPKAGFALGIYKAP